MTMIRKSRGWEIPEREATPESCYFDRRRFLAALGLGGIAVAGGLAGLACAAPKGEAPAAGAKGASGPSTSAGSQGSAGGGRIVIPGSVEPTISGLYPAKRNPAYTLDRPLSEEATVARYNNFYEFSTNKDVWRFVDGFKPFPWKIEIGGLVEKPQTLDIDDLLKKMPLEERLYRHRCVEAWAMAVPWTGFPLRALLDRAKPLSSARFVRMLSFKRPDEAPGQSATWFTWPYYEGLSIAEATNDLAFLATGIYGHPLPKQQGAPIRLVTPWKYGYKSIKSILRIDLVNEKPRTFWNDQAPDEYGFVSNVDPKVPHPRWSQASERMIDTGDYRPTQLYNGYGEWVAKLYT